jgi:hypothetical protein
MVRVAPSGKSTAAMNTSVWPINQTKCDADGRRINYRSLVENRRCQGDRVVQHTALYLGEINDSQKAQCLHHP